MLRSQGKVLAAMLAGVLGLAVTGCSSLNHFSDVSTATSALPGISGMLHGGQAPVAGATVTMYAANTTANKGISTVVGTTTTLANGSFSFSPSAPGICPTPQSLVYLVATNGNPGMATGTNNLQLAMMTLVGTCQNLTAATFVSVNELTTVAAIESVGQLMADPLHVGSSSAATLAGAFAGANALVDSSRGGFPLVFPAVPLTQAQLLLNTLADILAACVNSPGGQYGDSSACGQLEQYASVAGQNNTINSMQGIAQNPAQNIAKLYGLITGAAPFLPYLGKPPTDFTLAQTIALPVSGTSATAPFTAYQMVISKGITLDISGTYISDPTDQVWLYLPLASTYGGVSMPAGSLIVYSALTGNVVYEFAGNTLYSGTGFVGSFKVNAPSQLAPQAGGGIWALNSDGTMSNIGGPQASTIVSFPTNNGTVPATTPTGNLPIDQTTMTVDPSGNVWSEWEYSCFVEFSPSGTLLKDPWGTGNPQTFCPPLPLYAFPNTMASDENGNVYMYGQAGATLGTTSNLPYAVFKFGPTGTLLSPAGFNQGGFGVNSLVDLMTYDRTNDELWLLNTDQGSGVSGLDVIKADGTPISGNSGLTMPGVAVSPFVGMAVDGAGNMWMPDAYGALHEFSPSGAILSPNSTTFGLAGYHPPGLNLPGPISIDASGNIWIVNWGDNNLIKITGLAVPKSYQ